MMQLDPSATLVAARGAYARPSAILVALLLVAQGVVSSSALAQQSTDSEQLLRIIEEQQRRLDAQAAQLAEQQKALEALRREVRAIQGSAQPSAKQAAADTEIPSSSSFKELKKDAAAAREAWPGSFSLPGTDTRMKISGFLELDVIHDNGAILTPSAFVTHAIVTHNKTAAEGADGQTNFSVQASRLQLETQTPLADDQQLNTLVAVDFFNDFSSTTPELRLREAYGEINDVLFGGSLLLGQTWSTYTNMYSYPNVLDFQGPNALFGTRHPLVRWTKKVGDVLTVKLAGEAPDVRNFEGASATSTWPDGVVALGWENDAVNIQGSLLARDLRASANNGVVDAFGWGASVSGRARMPWASTQDYATFSLTYGEGIGGVFNDVPPDASYDSVGNDLEAIPTLAWFASYAHWWDPKFSSVFSYAEVRQDNLGFQAPTAYKKTQYATANLIWTPWPQWLLGIEADYGTREDKDGAKGSVVRTLFTSRFMF